MKRSVGLWVILVLLVSALTWVVGCRNDIDVPFPESLIGDYEGIYLYRAIENGIDTIVDTSQLVTFWFTNDVYLMTKDGTIPESLRVFCDVEGIYEIENGFQLTIVDPNRSRGVCTFDQNPFGSYGLDQTSDTIRMRHDSTGENGVRLIRYIRMIRTR